MSQTSQPSSIESGPSSPSPSSPAPVTTPPLATVKSPHSPSRAVSSPIVGGLGSASLDELIAHATPDAPAAPVTPRNFSTARYPPTGFGDRLANARNLRPDDAPPATPPRAVSNPVNPFLVGSSSARSLGDLARPQGEPMQKLFPANSGVKASYISPYDSFGVPPGDKHLKADSTTVEEFEAKYGAAAVRARALRQAAAAKRDVKKENVLAKFPAALVSKKTEASELKDDRLLLLGPFKLIRAEAATKGKSDADMAQLDAWLSAYMHEDLHEVHERDEMIPSVVYSVKIPMTEENWANYLQALLYFLEARDLHNLLAFGKEKFDEVTAAHRAEGGALTWPLLTAPGRTLEEICALLIKQNRLSVPWDYARMNHHPELVPEELGGRLKNYPLHINSRF